MSAAIRVLVVDDHRVVRRGLRAFLDGEPDLSVVGEAVDGGAALDELARLDARGQRPDVVLMDLQMEPVDGVAATRAIRERYDDVEVVALTSFDDEERVHAALLAGASGYILKDADPEPVAAAVRAAHHGQLQLDGAIARQLLRSLPKPRVHTPALGLTEREREILGLLAEGRANREIAAELVIADRTARAHFARTPPTPGLASPTPGPLGAGRAGHAPPPR
jgi:DNA-binding NarL/FixJ family response regulator